ncbi:MAG TPA: ABC transporter permease [Anaeromyxobacteraceae bacterium]|nr:ABC transporter permease [Anaeromyxobacteraceae bacterium]
MSAGARRPPRGWIQYAAVVRKEVLQTLRDRRIMFMLVFAPFLQTVVLGFAVDFDVDRVPTVVADQDDTPASREHVRRLLADGTLRYAGRAASAEDGVKALDRGEAAAVLVLPPRLGADLAAGRPAEVQVVLDGTDPNRSGVAGGAAVRYFGEQAAKGARERAQAAGAPLPARVEVTPRVFYNPSLKSPPYIVPGIAAMLLVIVTTIVTAMGLSREREQGTLEQVAVTPIQPAWLLAGKMTPFVFIGLFDVLLLVTAGTWIFGVPLRGNLAVLAVATLLYLLSTLGVGLLISTVSSNQQQSFLGGFLFILPAALLSGIMTPIDSMPGWMQWITYANPLRYFQEVTRANLMKGAGFPECWPELVALALFGAAIFGLATLRFRRRLA